MYIFLYKILKYNLSIKKNDAKMSLYVKLAWEDNHE
ncbi:MAG: hypothetical protein K0S71_2605 [Clostridia bacterium]|jgi:hypothetical protein|nr:hypothetical protein [Clostridia bacterium]